MERVVNWITDACLCVWSLLYWNTRKSRYAWSGRRGRCPCQDPSDFGSRGLVHCEASMPLHKRLRFRWVCPLLVAGPNGREALCSVSSGQVRPFWGRAWMFFGVLIAALYLVGATGIYTGMRVTGVETIRWSQLLWPGSWEKIPRARSDYFLRRALVACTRGDYREAYRSMATAVEQDGRNYNARLLMAQYAEFAGDTITGDQLFARISAEFPQNETRTAVTLHDTLLAVGRHNALAVYCLRMAAAGRDDASIWIGSLSLAMQLGHLGADFIANHQAELSRLDADALRLVQAEAEISDGNTPAALALLRHAFPPPVNGNYVMQQIQMCLRAKAPMDAEMAWTINAQGLNDFDRRLSRVWVDRGRGYSALADLEFNNLADLPFDFQRLGKLAASLVMQPGREAFLCLHRRVLKNAGAITLQAAGDMWVAALVCDADEQRDYWAALCKNRFGTAYPHLSAIRFSSLDSRRSDTVPFLVNTCVFSRETITSLYWRTDVASGTLHEETEPAERMKAQSR